jgi:iron complex transport system ATP-binding protein
MEPLDTVIELVNLTAGYRRGKKTHPVIRDLNAGLNKGEMVCLVGKNGIGKSTLLRSIAGIQPLLGGEVFLNGKPVTRYTILEMAKTVSLVLTDRIFAGNLKVEELVSLGRHPYTNWLGTLSAEDREKINWALDICGIREITHQSIGELSDGQFQKVLIARALAQDGDIILLDEPTAHLDLPNKIAILKLLKDLCDQTGKSILMATHELDFAFQMADRIWMVVNEDEMIDGLPEDLILDHSFEKLIDHKAVDFNLENGRFSIHHDKKWFCNLEGDPIAVFWTANALHRLRWEVTEKESPVKIKAQKKDDQYQWEIVQADDHYKLSKMEEVVNTLNNLMKV